MGATNEVGSVYWDARLDLDGLRADQARAEEQLRKTGRVGDTAIADGMRKGARSGSQAVEAEARRAGDATEKHLGGSAGRVREGFSKVQTAVAAIGVGLGIATLTSFAGEASRAFSDLNETISRSSQVLGSEAMPELESWAASASRAFGQSKRQALDGAATFAVFGKSAGLARADLVAFSTDLVELASDLASLSNTTPEEAIEAIGAALRGEAEPIRRYGVLLDEATLRQRALKEGIVQTTTAALTPQQRVLAAYSHAVYLLGVLARLDQVDVGRVGLKSCSSSGCDPRAQRAYSSAASWPTRL